MDEPDVTVVIPTRNRWSFLARTLHSALAQESVSLEVVVVDEASEDGTAEQVTALADERVRLVRHERPLGVARARNSGLAAARGRWYAALDDDDLWSPNKLRAQLTAAAAADAAWVYSSVMLVDEQLSPIEHHPAGSADGLLERLLAGPTSPVPAGASNVCVRTDLLRDVGGFDDRLFQLADWDAWISLAERAAPATCSETHVAYVHHAGSMLVTDRRPLAEELGLFLDKHADLRRREGVPFDQIGFERWTAWGRRRAGHRLAAARIYLLSALHNRSPPDVLRAGGALMGEASWRRAAPRPPPPGEVPRWLADLAGGAA